MNYTLKELDDSNLISLYINGNESCLSELISRHEKRIFSYIFSKTFDRDLSNDLYQDTFIKIIHTLKRGKYNEEGKFLPWALRIAHNLTMDYYRDRKRKKTKYASENYDVFDYMAAEELNAEDQIELGQTFNNLSSLITELPYNQQEVLKMRIYMDLSFKEIADHCGVSINTALGRMRYAILNLRKRVLEQEVVKDRT